jgi:hypothetical protein
MSSVPLQPVLAVDADLALGLVCDINALIHLFVIPELWPAASDPAAEDPAAARLAIPSATDGLVLPRRVYKYVVAGMTAAKVVGTPPLPRRQAGDLLED